MMAELPQPTELPHDSANVIGNLNANAKEFFFERWETSFGYLKDDITDILGDLLGWVCLVLIVPLLTFGVAELATFGMDMPTEPSQSDLEANYGQWAFLQVRRVKSEILEEIRKDRSAGGLDTPAPVQKRGFVDAYEAPQETDPKGDQSESPMPSQPSPTGVLNHPTLTSPEETEVDVAATQSPATVEATLTPMATDMPAPTPTNTPVPTNPPPTETSMVTICHKPGERQRTLLVPESDVPGHLVHGDYPGVCNET